MCQSVVLHAEDSRHLALPAPPTGLLYMYGPNGSSPIIPDFQDNQHCVLTGAQHRLGKSLRLGQEGGCQEKWTCEPTVPAEDLQEEAGKTEPRWGVIPSLLFPQETWV